MQLKIFAYYYLWYEGLENRRNITWNRDYPPALGFYRSDDADVQRQHLLWAGEYGIDGFLIEWYGTELEDAIYTDKSLKGMREVMTGFPGFQYAVFYDQRIRFGGLDFGGPDKREAFLSDLEYVAVENFQHPNYFFIDGRPVVVIYLTRAAFQGYGSLLDEARDRIARASGFAPYLIGDDIWWSRKVPYRDYLDAVTAFNLHSNNELEPIGGDVRAFVDNSVELYGRTLGKARREGAAFVPGVGVAYNDDAVRSNIPILPTWSPGEMPRYREDMTYALNSMLQVFELRNPMWDDYGLAPVFINSFNEWPERSAVEPSAEIEAFNQFYDYSSGRRIVLPAHGYQYLEGIREARREIQLALDAR